MTEPDRERSLHVPPRSRVAFVATLGSLALEPAEVDLARLRSLVEHLEPDLLAVEADPAEWEAGIRTGIAREIVDALEPATRVTDTVVVPIGGLSGCELAPPDTGALAGPRTALIRAGDRLLMTVAREYDSPKPVTRVLYRQLCELVCHTEHAASSPAGKAAWRETNERILENLVAAARRDPGSSILAAVQCRRINWLTRQLRRKRDAIDLVPFEALTDGALTRVRVAS